MNFSYNYWQNDINYNPLFPFYVFPFRSENATFHWHPGDNLYESVHLNIIELIDLHNGDYLGKELKIKIILYNIILSIYNKNRFIIHNNSTPLDRHLDYVRSSIKYMEDNYDSDITIDILSKNLKKNIMLRRINIRKTFIMIIDSTIKTSSRIIHKILQL